MRLSAANGVQISLFDVQDGMPFFRMNKRAICQHLGIKVITEVGTTPNERKAIIEKALDDMVFVGVGLTCGCFVQELNITPAMRHNRYIEFGIDLRNAATPFELMMVELVKQVEHKEKHMQTFTVDEVIQEIAQVLTEWDGKAIEDIANRVLSQPVTYNEDSYFEQAEDVIHEATPMQTVRIVVDELMTLVAGIDSSDDSVGYVVVDENVFTAIGTLVQRLHTVLKEG